MSVKVVGVWRTGSSCRSDFSRLLYALLRVDVSPIPVSGSSLQVQRRVTVIDWLPKFVIELQNHTLVVERELVLVPRRNSIASWSEL